MGVSKIIKKKRDNEGFYNYYDQYTLRRASMMYVCINVQLLFVNLKGNNLKGSIN